MNKNRGEEKFLTTLDFLRGIACLMVVLYHFSTQNSYYGYYLSENNFLRIVGSYGWMGVQIFFVVSGFVIPYSLYKATYTYKDFLIFFAKRWWRLWPPYVVSLLLVVLHTWGHAAIWGHEFSVDWVNVGLHLIYVPTFFGYDWYNILYWTLGIEFQFYLFIALMYPLFVNSNKIIQYGSIILFVSLFYFFPSEKLLFSQSAIFLVGILSFLYYIKKLNGIEFLISMTLAVPMIYAQYSTYVLPISLLSLTCGGLIVWTSIDIELGKKLGRISYSLYLIHGMVAVNLLILSMRVPFVETHEWCRTIIVLLGIALSILGAYIFWYLFEAPSQRKSNAIRYLR